jgi:hypothetical protein
MEKTMKMVEQQNNICMQPILNQVSFAQNRTQKPHVATTLNVGQDIMAWGETVSDQEMG